MKNYAMIASVGFSFAFTNFAQAKIEYGNFEGVFANLYATAPKSHTRLPEFNSLCNSTHGSFLNTPFSVDYRVNTRTEFVSGLLMYANAKTLLTGRPTYDSDTPTVTDVYTARAHEFSREFSDLKLKLAVFTLSKTFDESSLHVVFENTDSQTTKTYQCVLST